MSVKKVVIEKKDFPPLSPDGKYLLRYRIISEDKNRTSHWSPVYKLDATLLIQAVSGDLQISNSSLAISAVWGESQLSSSYDIFVSSGIYNVGTSSIDWSNYVYHGSSLTPAYSFLRSSATTDIRVKIQLSGIEKEVNPTLTICTLEKSRR